MHSSWNAYNGFRGKPADLVRAFKAAVGESGLLVVGTKLGSTNAQYDDFELEAL